MIPGIFFSIDRGSERASCGSRVERGKIFDSGDLYVLSFVTARITAMSHLSEWTLGMETEMMSSTIGSFVFIRSTRIIVL